MLIGPCQQEDCLLCLTVNPGSYTHKEDILLHELPGLPDLLNMHIASALPFPCPYAHAPRLQRKHAGSVYRTTTEFGLQ